MTLAQSILKTTRTLTLLVKINGVTIQPSNPTSATGVPGISAIRIQNRIGTCPVAAIEVSRTPAWITRGMSVTIDVGYDGFTRRRFTGTVQDRSKGIARGQINCVGSSSPLYTTSIIPNQDFSGQTTAAALATLAAYVGVVNRSIVTTRADVPEFTMGTATPTVLQNMSALQMANYVMELQGCKVFETGAGVTVVGVIDQIPAPTPLKTYTTNDNSTARILASDLREDPTFVRTRVKVTGATPAGGTTLTATEVIGGVSPLVKPPLPANSYIDAGVFNSLADTQAKVNAMAVFYLTQWHRVPKYLDVDLPGDPELECGATLGLVILELDLNGNFFIDGWQDEITIPEPSGVARALGTALRLTKGFERGEAVRGGGYRTTLQGLRGGDDLGGTLTLAPVPVFTVSVEKEVFGSGTTAFVVVTWDASGSYDPDGSIASYSMTSNKTLIPDIKTTPATTKTGTVRIDSASLDGTGADLTLTLTVTDNSGATASLTQTVPYTSAEKVTIPALGLAYNSGFGLSPDGAQHWNFLTGATCISIGMRQADGVHFGYACAGFSNGVIKRTTDGGLTSATVYTLASGAAINDVQWDWRNGNVVWALSEDCQLLISLDQGATWTVYSALRTNPAISAPTRGGLEFAQGSYVGNGLVNNDVQQIVGLGFTPKVVFVKADAATNGHGMLRTDTMGTAKNCTNSSNSQNISSLDVDGFTVKHLTTDVNGRTNVSGVTYYWWAIGGTSVKTGTYAGTGVAHGITGVGFAPALVMLTDLTENTSVRYRSTSVSGDTLSLSTAHNPNEITSLDADGFTVDTGASVNTNTNTYHYFAVKPAANFAEGTYTGNGTDNRNLPAAALTFNPQLVQTRIGGGAAQFAVFKGASLAGDAALNYSNLASAANKIQSLTPAAGKFQVGTDNEVNANAFAYYWFAFDVTPVAGGALNAALGNTIGLPAAGGVYVNGGTGTGQPLRAYDPAVGAQTWVQQAFTGDLLTDAVTTPADATMRIVGHSAPGVGPTEVLILAWASGGGALLVAIYQSTAGGGPSAAWTRATGLTAGLKNGRYVVPDPLSGDGFFFAAFGDQDIWQTVDGIAWSKVAGSPIMPAGVTPNHAIYGAGPLVGLPDAHLWFIAAENAGNTVSLYKGAPGMLSVTPLLPAGGSWPAQPASGKGKRVSVGAPGASSQAASASVAVLA